MENQTDDNIMKNEASENETILCTCLKIVSLLLSTEMKQVMHPKN